MARMAGSSARRTDPPWFAALEASADAGPNSAKAPGWSIDDETVDESLHESSWLLRRGLQVDENPPLEAIPPEWQWRWWIASLKAA